jgi:hypothetical protein
MAVRLRRRSSCIVLTSLALTAYVWTGCGGSATPVRAPLDPSAPRFGPAPRWRPPALSPASAAGRPLGGLRCTRASRTRLRAHLEVFVDGLDVLIPPGIGVAAPQRRDGAYVTGGSCYYPLRTTDPTGVIEVASGRRLTLGDLFDVWGQALSQRRMLDFGARPGRRVTVFVDGRRWPGGVRAVPLRRHASIVLELGRRVARHPVYLFPAGQ